METRKTIRCLSLRYTDGKLDEVTMHNPTHVEVTDCRDLSRGDPPFVSIQFGDGQIHTDVYFPPELANTLYEKLGRLFGVDSRQTKHPGGWNRSEPELRASAAAAGFLEQAMGDAL